MIEVTEEETCRHLSHSLSFMLALHYYFIRSYPLLRACSQRGSISPQHYLNTGHWSWQRYGTWEEECGIQFLLKQSFQQWRLVIDIAAKLKHLQKEVYVCLIARHLFSSTEFSCLRCLQASEVFVLQIRNPGRELCAVCGGSAVARVGRGVFSATRWHTTQNASFRRRAFILLWLHICSPFVSEWKHFCPPPSPPLNVFVSGVQRTV